MIPLNYLAIFVCSAIAVGIDTLWYGPFLSHYTGRVLRLHPDDFASMHPLGMNRSTIAMGISSLLMYWILAHVLVFASVYLSVDGALAGTVIGFLAWLGFVVPINAQATLRGRTSWQSTLMDTGYYLVSLTLSGMILAVWK
jgi:hypothetical protein